MVKKRLLWQLYPSYLLLTIAAVVAAGWFASHSLRTFFDDSVRRTLHARAQWIDRLIGDGPALEVGPESRRILELSTLDSDARLTLIRADGEVLFESGVPPGERIENHLHRPEVQAAMAGEIGTARRVSETIGQKLEYLAIPLRRDGAIVGVVRAAVPVTSIDRDLRTIQWQIGTAAVGIVALAALVGLLVSRRITRPLEEMRAGAERFAKGELGGRLEVPDTAEMARLAETLNHMAGQLEERIRGMARQGNEQRAVLASMVEGVLAVDLQQRIISLNRAAADLLGYSQSSAAGRTLQEVIRNAELRRLAGDALQSDEPITRDVVMRGEHERVVQAHGAALRDAGGVIIGAVIVLNDMTEYRKLENIRRDFVANVSHELKTPITSIKGFVETLLDGALDQRDDAVRFLKIIGKQADRLHAIIDDLLSLSRIEQSEGDDDLSLEVVPLVEVLDAAVRECAAQAAERGVEISIECDPSLRVGVNPPLMEQAIINLLDNAIKYSDAGGQIKLRAAPQADQALVVVQDQGCGIPAKHLPRIFERFYRVDRARSRAAGGTGLGLSIVKHIVNAHRGRVTVESTPGKGTTFFIQLPRETAAAKPALIKS